MQLVGGSSNFSFPAISSNPSDPSALSPGLVFFSQAASFLVSRLSVSLRIVWDGKLSARRKDRRLHPIKEPILPKKPTAAVHRQQRHRPTRSQPVNTVRFSIWSYTCLTPQNESDSSRFNSSTPHRGEEDSSSASWPRAWPTGSLRRVAVTLLRERLLSIRLRSTVNNGTDRRVASR